MAKKTKSSASYPSDGSKTGLILIHTLFTIIYALSLYNVHAGPQLPVNKPQGKLLGSLKYLTIWDVHFQLWISILNLLVTLTNCDRLTKFRNAIHHGLSFPFGVSVMTLFWSICAVDRRLVFLKEIDDIIPPLFNQVLHTLVGISPIINEFICYNERKSAHFLICLTVFFLYLTQLFAFGYYLDYWIYPIFDVLDHFGRGFFIVICTVLMVLVYLTHGAFHNLLWSKRIKHSKKKRN